MRAFALMMIPLGLLGCPDDKGGEAPAQTHPLLVARCKAGTEAACDELAAKCEEGDEGACTARDEADKSRSVPMGQGPAPSGAPPAKAK